MMAFICFSFGAKAQPASQTTAQGAAVPAECGTDQAMSAYYAANPTALAQRQLKEQAFQAALAQGSLLPSGNIIIPIVVHYMYTTPNEPTNAEKGVIAAKVANMVQSLNEDFSGTNAELLIANGTLERDYFFNLIGYETNIQFCLANKDLSGLQTTGIIYHAGGTNYDINVLGLHSIPLLHQQSPEWDKSHYLNIYAVENIGDGVLINSSIAGFALYPNSDAANDGSIVIAQPWLENSGTRRTVTHEVGHYFNLYHLWGDNNTGTGNCADDLYLGGDHVADTPNQLASNSASAQPLFPHVTCTDPQGDMFISHMDYSAQRYAFSAGQITRMRACFFPPSVGGTGGRESFVTSTPNFYTKCLPTISLSVESDVVCSPGTVDLTVTYPLGADVNDPLFVLTCFKGSSTIPLPFTTVSTTIDTRIIRVPISVTTDFKVVLSYNNTASNPLSVEKTIRIYCAQAFNSNNINQAVNAGIINSISAVGALQTSPTTFSWTVSSPAFVTGNVIVPDGITLIIRDKVLMPRDSRIIVQPGGKLILENGTILTACSGGWKGIEVRSDELTGKRGSLLALQGGITIEHAMIGILSGSRGDAATNGIPYKSGATINIGATQNSLPSFIRNNQIGISLNTNTIDHSDIVPHARIFNCKFTFDNAYRFGLVLSEGSPTFFSQIPQPVCIKIANDRAIEISNCLFENQNTSIAQWGRGIVSNFGNFDCRRSSQFNRLWYGIYATRGFLSPSNFAARAISPTDPVPPQYPLVPVENVLIHQCSFATCSNAIYAAGFATNYSDYTAATTGLRILNNAIDGSRLFASTGVYLLSCTKFILQNNVFESLHNALVVYKTGANNNQIYRNTFSKEHPNKLCITVSGVNRDFLPTTATHVSGPG